MSYMWQSCNIIQSKEEGVKLAQHEIVLRAQKEKEEKEQKEKERLEKLAQHAEEKGKLCMITLHGQ